MMKTAATKILAFCNVSPNMLTVVWMVKMNDAEPKNVRTVPSLCVRLSTVKVKSAFVLSVSFHPLFFLLIALLL